MDCAFSIMCKSHRQSHVHLDFIPCYLPGVLEFCFTFSFILILSFVKGVLSVSKFGLEFFIFGWLGGLGNCLFYFVLLQ
jgi:hypothetical protein